MPRLLAASAHRRVPWRNGLGVTDEIVVEPHPRDPGRFAWRLSMAQVSAAGPFSSFPGVDRTLILVEGAGMRLRFGDGAWTTLSVPFEPIRFAGETPVECELLAGPVRDFNVMADREVCSAAVECVVRECVAPRVDSHATNVVIVSLAGVVIVEVAGRSQALSANDGLRVDAEEAGEIELVDARGGAAVVVRLSAH